MNGFAQQAESMSERMAKTFMSRFEPGKVLLCSIGVHVSSHINSDEPVLRPLNHVVWSHEQREERPHPWIPPKTIFDSLEENGDLGLRKLRSGFSQAQIWVLSTQLQHQLHLPFGSHCALALAQNSAFAAKEK
ncbi:hypothetical protein SLEP1_g28800 [Rubroshorea leprosula]|uniref:Uncharacterized protein n=1 Tax=Rubroshorea leprosula TaxID=152421 RepID=A0AAV5K4A1_9ROSI|nr:hypothetical protein SLEP1_g28800 [Rubroshorea leprosula]